MRLRILICLLIVVTIGTILYRCSVPFAPTVTPPPFANSHPGKIPFPAIAPYANAPEKPAEKAIPKNWSRHKFNDGEFYVVPLACD